MQRAGRTDTPWQPDRDVWWHELVAQQPDTLPAVETEANEPYMVIYTSGTTGRPKGAVHVHAGFPIKAAQDMAHCFDIQADDRVWWYTDLGWMMGPWLISGALLLGATVFLYDGAPDWPAPDRLWATAARQRITTLGLAPTGVRALMRADPDGPTRHDLSGLRALAASGEPWNPEPWWWYFRQVGGGRCPLINYSGGTEISGGIVAATTVEPQQPCAFAGPVPGMAADVVDEAGQPVRGRVGELVLRGPWVGMTNGFWRDRERYLETYWSRWPGVWAHGDWALIADDGSWYIHGRSDDTLKIAGKRIGPAEVESAAVTHPAVAEAAAIGVPDEIKGESVVVFAVPTREPAASAGTTVAVADTVAAQLGKPLRPAAVHFVTELPRTRSNKIMRRVIRATYLAEDPGDVSSLENPSALEAIRDIRGEVGEAGQTSPPGPLSTIWRGGVGWGAGGVPETEGPHTRGARPRVGRKLDGRMHLMGGGGGSPYTRDGAQPRGCQGGAGAWMARWHLMGTWWNRGGLGAVGVRGSGCWEWQECGARRPPGAAGAGRPARARWRWARHSDGHDPAPPPYWRGGGHDPVP